MLTLETTPLKLIRIYLSVKSALPTCQFASSNALSKYYLPFQAVGDTKSRVKGWIFYQFLNIVVVVFYFVFVVLFLVLVWIVSPQMAQNNSIWLSYLYFFREKMSALCDQKPKGLTLLDECYDCYFSYRLTRHMIIKNIGTWWRKPSARETSNHSVA